MNEQEFIDFKMKMIHDNIHEVCYFCKNDCKEEYSHWSGQMPPDIFCDNYIDKEVSDE